MWLKANRLSLFQEICVSGWWVFWWCVFLTHKEKLVSLCLAFCISSLVSFYLSLYARHPGIYTVHHGKAILTYSVKEWNLLVGKEPFCDLEHEEAAGSAAEVGAADWKTLSYLGYLLLVVSIPLLKTVFCSESPDQMLGSVFPENKCLTVAETAEHVIKGCHMGHLLTMKNECTICQAVIETEEQFQFSLPLLIWLSVSQCINSFLPYYS